MHESYEASDSGDLNVYAMADQLVVEVPVPGIKPHDIDVSLEDRTLTIRTHPNGKLSSAKRTYLLHGYEPLSMMRCVQLPDGVDTKSGRGSLELGLLRLRFRRVGEPRRHIPVRADGPAFVPLRRVEPGGTSASSGPLPSSGPSPALLVGDGQPKSYATGLLSPREQEVLRLMTAGRTNKEIARQLVISVSTVNYHVASVLTKLGAGNRTEAATIVSQHRLLLEARCPD
jgi:DNA-binding CsgD family transcriptional regulator/HSP20 family molecular chaperone IbpA